MAMPYPMPYPFPDEPGYGHAAPAYGGAVGRVKIQVNTDQKTNYLLYNFSYVPK